MLDAKAVLVALEHRLDRVLLGAVDDVLDHRTGVEVLEVHDLFVAVGIGDLEEAVVVDLGVHPLDDLLDHRLDAHAPIAAEFGQILGVQRQTLNQILAEDVLRRFGIRSLDLDLDVQATGPQDRRIDHVLAVGGTDDDDVLQTLHTVDLAEQLGHDGGLDVGADAGAAGAEDRVHLVEEHDHRCALGGLLAGPLEDQPDVTLGLADELVQQFRALDVEEVRLGLAGVLAADLRHLLGQRVRHGLGDQRLTASGRAVEQHTLGRPQRVLAVELLVQEGQFDGVADLFDLSGQAADIAVGDIGHLFENKVLDLGLGDPLEGVAGLAVDQQRVAGAQLAGALIVVESFSHLRRHILERHQRLGQPDDALLVGVADHQCATPVGQQLTKGADLADRLEGAGLDHGQRLVEPDRLALFEGLDVDIGRAGQSHLAAGGEYVEGVILMGAEQHAVPAGRLTQPVDLLTQREQLLAGVFEGVHQLGVAGSQRIDPGLELLDLTSAAGSTHRILQLFAQQ